MATSKKRTVKTKNKKNKGAPLQQAVVEAPETPPETSEELQRDLLDDFLFHAANYIYVRRKLFITIGILVAALILSAYGTFRYIQYQDNLRNEELYAIEKVLKSSDLESEQAVKELLPMLNRFLEAHPETRQATLALMHRGSLNSSQKNYAEAESDFKSIRSSVPKESEFYILASIYLSNVLRDQGKTEDAIAVLKSAQTDKMTDIILMELAELYMQADQKDKAKETLDILLADYPSGPFAERARQLNKLL